MRRIACIGWLKMFTTGLVHLVARTNRPMWALLYVRYYVLVIDANFPWAAEKIITDIKAITPKPVRFVFNTHYHADHTLGNSVFTAHGATIVSTDDLDRAWCQGKMSGIRPRSI